MSSGSLSHAVEAFARAATALGDAELSAVIAAPMDETDRWRHYDRSQREPFYHVYQELRELAVDIAADRATAAPPTTAQRVLAQHQSAYRVFTGALAGVSDEELDREFAAGEWPLRMVLEHVMRAELGFALQIEWAIARRDSGESFPVQMPYEGEPLRRYNEIDASGSLADILGRYDTLHTRIVSDCVTLTDADLATPSVWWEESAIPVRFRMQRWDAHLREHTIQVEKTLAGIGHPQREVEHLIRLIYGALGECEGALTGAPDTLIERQHAVAATIDSRTALFQG